MVIKMSKRFGRNQKRKLKKQIDQLNLAVKKAEAYAKSNYKARVVLGNMLNVIGNYFVAFDPMLIELHSTDQKFINILSSKIEDWRKTPWEDPVPVANETMKILKMPTIIPKIQKLFDSTHIQLSYNGEVVGYSISEEAIHYIPHELLIENISKVVAEQLARRLQRNK